jgi:CheY-like chemotaxis protein
MNKVGNDTGTKHCNPAKGGTVWDASQALGKLLILKVLNPRRSRVATAEDGFDALLKLKQFLPDVIISDLNMPKMSGFEFLSVVRRRFPKISVIASSGAYQSRVVPTGVLADAFFAKGQEHTETLLNSVSDLIQTSAASGGVCPGLDSAEWERLKRNTLYRDYLYGMFAVLPAECDKRGEPGGSRNTLSLLLEQS